MTWVFLILLAVAAMAIVVSTRRNRVRLAELEVAELEPVKKLAFEDTTALGDELQDLDADSPGSPGPRSTRSARGLPAGAGRLRGRQDRR